MEEMFWTELRSRSDKDLEKVIEMAREQLNINRYNRKMNALKNLFAALNELAEADEKYLYLYKNKNEDGGITVQDIAHYLIDEYDF
jgi:uncharacterized protein YpuA (DUF1002 family)